MRYLQPATAGRTAAQVKQMEAPFDSDFEDIYVAVALIRSLEHLLDTAYLRMAELAAELRAVEAKNRELSEALYTKKPAG